MYMNIYIHIYIHTYIYEWQYHTCWLGKKRERTALAKSAHQICSSFLMCSEQIVLCADLSLCYVQLLVCVVQFLVFVMCSSLSVLRAAFSLCYVQFAVTSLLTSLRACIASLRRACVCIENQSWCGVLLRQTSVKATNEIHPYVWIYIYIYLYVYMYLS